jgi:signal transduction histidine kinase
METRAEGILRLSNSKVKSYLKFGWPILSLIALIGAAVFLFLADIAREQDRTYQDTTRNFVRQASQNWVSTNAAISNEYGLWSDAYENITLSYNQDWIDGNFFSANINAIAILSPTKGLRNTYLGEGYEADGASVKKLVASLNVSHHAAYQAAPTKQNTVMKPNGLFVFDDHLAAVSVQPIRPEDTYPGKRPRPDTPIDLVVAIRIIDQAAIEDLGKSYGLNDARLHLGPTPRTVSSDRVVFELKGTNGQTLGWIDWAHLHPGTTAFSNRIGLILTGLLVLGLLTLAVTQRVMAAQVQLSDAARRSAEEASKTKSNFLANVSHELRTPLNAIIGYSEIVKEDCVESGAAQSARDMHKVIGSAQHLLGLINDLLDHSKIEAGKMDLNPTRVELVPLFESVGEALSSQIAKNNSRFVLVCDPLIGDAILDGMRLKQCLLNLVSNAAKFTHNGAITLSARAVDQNGVPFVRISVKDSGIGMSENTLAKLFKPFVQANAATAAQFGGTGLGLVITRALIEAMGGSVQVESVVGKGSVFTLLIPRGMATFAVAVPELEQAA